MQGLRTEGEVIETGTNFYLHRKKPTIHEAVHICKRSWGWRTSWQESTNDGTENAWPRWCDEDPCKDEDGHWKSERTLPWEIHSVDDIRRYLRTGEWELVDEYGEVYPDWETEIQGLVDWDGGKAGWNERHPDNPVTWEIHEHDGYRDSEGNIMCRRGFL